MPTSAQRAALTSRRIAQLEPKDRPYYFWDTKQPGLCVRVMPSGYKAFVFYRRIEGRPERITLGRVEAVPLDAARRAAAKMQGEVAVGLNPAKQKAQLRLRGQTIEGLVIKWLDVAKRKNRTWRSDKALFENHIRAILGKKQASEIDTATLQRFADRVAKDVGARSANRCLSLLSVAWNHAVRRGEADINPVSGVRRHPEVSRDRFLSRAEVSRFLEQVAVEPEPWRDFFILALLTGARRGALCRMKWSDIDFIQRVWQIPASDSKNRKRMAVPLVDAAMQILQTRYSQRVNPWVFPSASSRSGHVEDPRKPWLRIRGTAGLEDVRLHDVRRTVASWMGAAGASAFTIAAALGHRSTRSTEVYTRLDAHAVRPALEQVAGDLYGGISVLGPTT